MRKAKTAIGDDEMRPEYDFSNAVRGKYHARFTASSNVVVLDPDVSEVFPNAAAVNQALRALASVVRARAPIANKRSPRGSAHRTRTRKQGRRATGADR
jgi:hypothetical protein